MKKNILAFAISTIALFAFGTGAYAQSDTKKEVEFSSFTGIEADASCEIHVSTGSSYSATMDVPTEVKDYVEVYVKNNALFINFDTKNMPPELKKVYKKQDSRIPVFKVYVTAPSLKMVSLAGDSQLYADNINTNDNSFKASATGRSKISGLNIVSKEATVSLSKNAQASVTFSGSKITAESDNSSKLTLTTHTCKTVTTKLGGSSEIKLLGEMSYLETSGSNSSILNASEAVPGEVSVTVDGSSQTYIDTKGKLSLEMKGGATLYFKGKPEFDIVNIKNSSVSKFDSYPAK